MKKATLLLLFWVFLVSSFTQTYHPLVESNKIWTTAHTYGHPNVINSDAIKFDGDTTINGTVYKIAYRSTDNAQTTWNRYGFIREEDKKIYWLSWSGGAPNNLIYDFDADTGDTVYLFADPMGFYFVVDSIGETTMLTGESRRTTYLSGHDPGGFTMGNDTWVEGMGSMYGVLQSGTGVLIGDNPQLICFTQNDTLKYHNPNFELCYVIVGLEKQTSETNRLDISKDNNDRLMIQVDDPVLLPLQLEIFDLTGRLLLKKEIGQVTSSVDISIYGEKALLLCRMVDVNRGVLLVKKVLLK